ncbi:hypothetical protein ACFGVR_15075 [Mucilaginibacter sp. AW1-3]
MKKNIIIIILLLLSSHLQVKAQCFISSFGSLGALANSTGNAALDNKFRVTKNEIESLFNVSARLYVYDDGDRPNAYAKPSGDNNYDGIVAFGQNMLQQRLWNRNKGEAAIAGILAHEYGHVLQIKKGLSTSNSKKRELQADFLAGYFMGNHNYPQSSIQAFGADLASLGDYEFGSEDHHGTPAERLNAMLAGYGHGSESADAAYSAGLSYVNGGSYNPGKKTSGGGLGDDVPAPQPVPRKQILVACTHLAHPAGDLYPCTHALHPNGDVYPCTHACQGPYGIVACHPAGDVGPCTHRLHTNDVAPCQHPLHPGGDLVYQ